MVRRVQSGNTWHQATDSLQGTNVYGTPGAEDSNQSWSIQFDNMSYDQFLFATGDGSKWLIASRSEVERVGGSNFLANIIKSSTNSNPYQARWYD